jgi:hypothetical protein
VEGGGVRCTGMNHGHTSFTHTCEQSGHGCDYGTPHRRGCDLASRSRESSTCSSAAVDSAWTMAPSSWWYLPRASRKHREFGGHNVRERNKQSNMKRQDSKVVYRGDATYAALWSSAWGAGG